MLPVLQSGQPHFLGLSLKLAQTLASEFQLCITSLPDLLHLDPDSFWTNRTFLRIPAPQWAMLCSEMHHKPFNMSNSEASSWRAAPAFSGFNPMSKTFTLPPQKTLYAGASIVPPPPPPGLDARSIKHLDCRHLEKLRLAGICISPRPLFTCLVLEPCFLLKGSKLQWHPDRM